MSYDASNHANSAEDNIKSRLDPGIVEVYHQVGKYLSHYTSGKIPKAFKIISNLRNWEEILLLTNPNEWTAQATYVATKLFASNFNSRLAQRFYCFILLPRIRQDIEKNKKLNFHYYQAIKKAIYKPAAFFKGILLPLAEEGCTPREAVILSSILNKCAIPVLHSSVALLKLSQLEYSGTTCLFMKTLINKKYSLPIKVLSSLVQYFCSFLHDSRKMPLIWHQCLLTFIQRYKTELSSNQITAIRNLIRVQQHVGGIANEIRRELYSVTNPNALAAKMNSQSTNTATPMSLSNMNTPLFTPLAELVNRDKNNNNATFTLDEYMDM